MRVKEVQELHWVFTDYEYGLFNTFAASHLNTQGLNNSCLKSRQRRP